MTLPRGFPGSAGLIDEFIPEYQFHEIHRRRVNASPDSVLESARRVSAGEIPFFRLLTWIRRPRLPWTSRAPNILNAPADEPILDVATRSGFFWLADGASSRELVVGMLVICPAGLGVATPAEFASLREAGCAKAVLNFRACDDGSGGTQLTTETRVFATDPKTARRFGLYWFVIYPGSAFIRRMWLRAIARRAERGSPIPS